MSCDRQALLEPDLSIRIVVVARDVVVAGAFVKCDGLGEGGVGVEPNGLVAKVGSGRFKVAQQPGAEPCATPWSPMYCGKRCRGRRVRVGNVKKNPRSFRG